MKLAVVLGCVDANPEYYRFVGFQVQAWAALGVKFVAVFVGGAVPRVLTPFARHIVLWNATPELNSSYVAQNLRLYYPALLGPLAGEDGGVMITDMDMLPGRPDYYTRGLASFSNHEFVYFREVYKDREIYMCYNLAMPATWGAVFGVRTHVDVARRLREHYPADGGVLGCAGWTTDQQTMYRHVMRYPHVRILQRPLRRLETPEYARRLAQGETDFVREYDDIHFHRSFTRNAQLVSDAMSQRWRGGAGARVVFLTFGGPSEAYHSRVRAICKSAVAFGRFSRVVGVTEKDLQSDAAFWSVHGDFIERTPRGYGNYVWKPYLIAKFLRELADDEILVYLDCGCTLNPLGLARFDEYVWMVSSAADAAGPAMISFQMEHQAEIRYSKRALLEHMRPTAADLRSGQYVGGIQMMRRCARTAAFAEEWYAIAGMHALIDDTRGAEHAEFVDHRHDQSVYSLLAKRRGTISIPDETYFAPDWRAGSGFPFWATRNRGTA